jgi:hypothetical protein
VNLLELKAAQARGSTREEGGTREEHLLEEVEDDVRSVREKVVEVLEETKYSQDGITADVGVAMVQVVSHRGHEWLEQLNILELAHKPQRTSAYVLVGMIEIVAQGVAVCHVKPGVAGVNVSFLTHPPPPTPLHNQRFNRWERHYSFPTYLPPWWTTGKRKE